MPAGGYPFASHAHRNEIIEPQCKNGCTADRGLAHDSRTVVTPKKVARPTLATGIEQWNTITGQSIKCGGLRRLEAIAKSTREAQILLIILAAFNLRIDVFDLEHAVNEMLRTEAIRSPIARKDGTRRRISCDE